MTRTVTTVAALLCGVSFLAVGAAAQTHVEFSDTWVIDKEKSDKPRRLTATAAQGRASEGLSGGRRGGAPDAQRAEDCELPDITETIEQTADAIHIRSSDGSNRTYRFDGTPVTMKGPAGGQMTSVLKWKDRDLVIESEEPVETTRGKARIEIKEVRTLSRDGRVMTVHITISTPNGNGATRRVFNKVGEPGSGI